MLAPAESGAASRFVGASGRPYTFGFADDCAILSLEEPFGGDLASMGHLVRAALGDLLDEHDDERGVLVFPDMVKPKETRYDAIIVEVGELGEWAPNVADAVPDLDGMLGYAQQVMGAMGPDFADVAKSVMKNADVQGMVSGLNPEKLVGQDGGLDFGALMQAAQSMLAGNPELGEMIGRAMSNQGEEE